MLQRICDRCGKIIQSGLNLKIDVKNGELPSDMCLVRLDIRPFQTGVQSEIKQYELCKACKDELMSWLMNNKKLEDKND